MIYLDNQATTACDPAVVAAMMPWFTAEFGNPHSAEHEMGQRAAAAVEAARAHIAALIGAEPREIVFTSGATEANNLAIKGAARHAGAGGPRRIITLATEHKCVLQSVLDLAEEGFEPVVLPVRRNGLLDLDRLVEALRTPTLLVSIMAVNNETGILQDLAAIAPLVRQAGALLHADVAQAAGKIALDVNALGLHLASLSAHKMYGPKGIGALYVRRRPRIRLKPLFSGGGQERGLRSGTIPAPLAVGFGEAARLSAQNSAAENARIAALRDRLATRLQAAIPGLVHNNAGAPRIAGNLNLRLPGVAALDLIAAAPEICISTGSACTSAEIAPSHVLTAMGLTHAEAAGTLRIGIGRFTSAADIDDAADALAGAYDRIRPQPIHPVKTGLERAEA
jgi:cysteine desulfurase